VSEESDSAPRSRVGLLSRLVHSSWLWRASDPLCSGIYFGAVTSRNPTRERGIRLSASHTRRVTKSLGTFELALACGIDSGAVLSRNPTRE
jgi:hypothetical protein